MKRDSWWIGLATFGAVAVSFFSFTLALAYLQIPKEIPPLEKIEIPVTIPKLEELHKPQEPHKIKKEVKSKVNESKIVKNIKNTSHHYSCMIEKKLREGTHGTKTAKVAIILDDAGYTTNGFIRKLFQIQAPLTISILPGLKYSKETAQLAHKSGFEVMLHMPMEYCGNSKMPKKDESCKATHNMTPYKYAILTGMSKSEVEEEFEKAINSIPYVVGVNNHMGSKATTDEVIMSYMMDKLKVENLYFIDSLTTERSIAYDIAKRKGVPTSERSVFLDNINDTEYVKKRIKELIYTAKRKGHAIGIGHATKKATINALIEMIPKFKDYGVEIVPASQLVN